MTWIACDSAVPPPATITVGPVTITSAPLALHVAAPVPLDQVGFIEIGTVAEVDPTAYYDPRDRDPAITWHAPTRAVGVDGDWLVLDDRSRVRISDDGVGALVELDARDVAGAVLVRLVLPRAPDEPQYGFGEVATGADAAGRVIEMQLRVDAASASGLDEAHAPVPLALWPRRGAGLFIADRRPGAFDVGAARPDALLATFTLPARGPLGAHLFVGGDPAVPGAALALVRAYTTLTARPAVPPRWAFAPMQWRNVGQSSAEVRGDADTLRALAIPGSTLWIDNPWQTAYNDFTFDGARYADAAGLIRDLEARGFHVLLWSTPYVDNTGPTAADFADAAARKLLVTDDVGAPIAFPWQDGPGGMIDFTAPGATAWWRDRIARATALGVRGFKLDFGEEILPELGGNLFPARTVGGDASVMHRLYARGYHDAYLGALPPGDGFVITRAGTWGEQDVNTALWPGDLDNDLARAGDDGSGTRRVGGLPAAIACGLSLSASGYPFFGSDIGGYRGGPPTTEVLLRWAEYAALGTIMQLGGGGGAGDSHNPWDPRYAPDAVAIYRRYARLHMDLVPLLWELAQRAGADGTPATRPTRLVYPAAASDDDTFLLGDDIFVAPVVVAGATTRTVALPPGRWIDWWTGALTMSDGRTAITVAAPLDTLPLWRAANKFVPGYARAADTLVAATAPGITSYVDPAYGGELALTITPTGEPTAIALADATGATGSLEGTAYSIQYRLGPSWHHVTFDLDARATTVGVLAAPTGAELDGAALPAVADEAALFACGRGCWLWEPAARRLRVRVAGDGVARPLLIR
jgi:alpha-D-xyloside xylohydrolase